MGNEHASFADVKAAAEAANIAEMIESLPNGYQTVVSDSTGLSGGEKQRIAIARAILKDAPIIILDEATAYADAENESKIQDAFSKLSKGKTVIMIAHRLKTIQNADNILVMNNGRLEAVGRHEGTARKKREICGTLEQSAERRKLENCIIYKLRAIFPHCRRISLS